MLDVNKDQMLKSLSGFIVIGVIGLIVLIAGLTSGSIGAIIGGVIGLLIGVGVPLAMRNVFFRPRKLIVDRPGMRWDDPKGNLAWTVGWTELTGVAVSAGEHVVGRTTTTLVRVDMWPGQGFEQRHPELQRFWQHSGAQGCYRFPLGPTKKYAQQLDGAFRTFAPQLNAGTMSEGTRGLT